MEKEGVISAGALIRGMRELLGLYNSTNKAGIERIEVECRDTSTLSGKDYKYEFHITFTS